MAEVSTIQQSLASPDKRIGPVIVLLTLSFIIGSALRISLVVFYPFVALFIAVYYRFRLTASLIILIILAGLSWFLSLFEGFFLKYNVLSFFYMLPFLLLLFSDPAAKQNKQPAHLTLFIRCLTLIALINDVIGVAQIFYNPNSDDSFIGIYSEYSVSINGLMILNAVLFFYYFLCYRDKNTIVSLLLSVFFLGCAILGFYGAGLVVCTAAFILAFYRFQLTAIIKSFAIGLVSLATVSLVMMIVKPITFEYNVANLKKIISFDIKNGPRKLTSFYNYGISYPRDVKDFLFGSGPGTFNSRSAFMVGSPSYFQLFNFIKDEDKPYYFENYAYSLWNEKNTSKQLFLDGFRNQPFSSILAFMGEYGLIFTVCFFLLYYRYYRRVANVYYSSPNTSGSAVDFTFFKFLIILLPLLLLIDNYLEYPEIMLLLLLSIKLSHMALLNKTAGS